MRISTYLTSREFNQDTGKAKNAAKQGPVCITDRGEPAHVLLSYKEYETLVGSMSLLDAVAQPDSQDIEFVPPKSGKLHEPVDL